jgi:hypothetical protein
MTRNTVLSRRQLQSANQRLKSLTAKVNSQRVRQRAAIERDDRAAQAQTICQRIVDAAVAARSFPDAAAVTAAVRAHIPPPAVDAAAALALELRAARIVRYRMSYRPLAGVCAANAVQKDYLALHSHEVSSVRSYLAGMRKHAACGSQ